MSPPLLLFQLLRMLLLLQLLPTLSAAPVEKEQRRNPPEGDQLKAIDAIYQPAVLSLEGWLCEIVILTCAAGITLAFLLQHNARRATFSPLLATAALRTHSE